MEELPIYKANSQRRAFNQAPLNQHHLVANNATPHLRVRQLYNITSTKPIQIFEMAPKKAPAASVSAAPASKPTNFYVVDKVWNGYWETTSHQTLVIDAFLVFLLLVGGLQFLYFLTCSHDVSNQFGTFLLLSRNSPGGNTRADLRMISNSLTMPFSLASSPPLASSS